VQIEELASSALDAQNVRGGTERIPSRIFYWQRRCHRAKRVSVSNCRVPTVSGSSSRKYAMNLAAVIESMRHKGIARALVIQALEWG